MKTWTVEIEQDLINPDDLMIAFPDELMKELDWNEGDHLHWRINTDGTVTLSKKE